MELAGAIAYVIGGALLLCGLVRWLGGEATRPGDDGKKEPRIGFWNALGLLFLTKFAVKGVLWLIPGIDMPMRIAVSAGVYLVVLTGLLVVYARTAPIRSVLIAITVAFVLTLQGVLLVMGRDTKDDRQDPGATMESPRAEP